MGVELSPATPAEADAVAAIYNAAIEERSATFETRRRPAAEMAEQIEASALPSFVAREGDEVVGWGALAPYRDRAVYAGVAEASARLVERLLGD